ncbi:MAG: AAA family ATPase, partial [Fervidobacterium sp.]
MKNLYEKFKNANEKLELMTRVIGVLSGKGGVGKTTIVANLSAALTFKFNKKVTVIDCNLTTSHLGMHFGIFHYPKTFNDFLKGSSPIADVIFPHGTGV